MNLWDLQQFSEASIKGFNSKVEAKYQQRLRELGFEKGETVTCLRSAPYGGPKVFKVGDSVFSLAQDIASEVEVADQVY